MGFFKKVESYIGVDIGASSVKLMEIELGGGKPTIKAMHVAPTTGEIFQNNILTKTDKVSEVLHSILETHGITPKKVVTAVPSPSVFTKRIQTQKVTRAELSTHIQFEAGNFIPHSLDAVKLDYHVVGSVGKNQIEVLLVAAKNEAVDGYLESINLTGLEVAIVDVDYFALQNAFELNYPEFIQRTVALVNIGSRYTTINICRGGQSLFTGDVGVGGKLFTDALVNELGVSVQEAEALKRCTDEKHEKYLAAQEIIDKHVETVASELNRQLSFFWNSTGSDDGIDGIMLSGGGSMVRGLIEELGEKTGIECLILDPFKEVTIGAGIDSKTALSLGPVMAVCTGLAIRQNGDKEIPDYDQD